LQVTVCDHNFLQICFRPKRTRVYKKDMTLIGLRAIFWSLQMPGLGVNTDHYSERGQDVSGLGESSDLAVQTILACFQGPKEIVALPSKIIR